MSKYSFDRYKNNVTIDESYDLYNTLNVIKNINDHVHYFFNGFSEIKDTNEVVINLIKADLNFKEYHNIMYYDNGADIIFLEKYEFVNFNKIKNNEIKHEIAMAIKERNPSGFHEALIETSSLMFNPVSLKPFYTWEGIGLSGFDFKNEGLLVERLLIIVII